MERIKIKIRLTTLTGGQPYQSFSKLCKIFRAAKVRKIIGILESEDGMGKLGRTLGRAIVVFA